MKGMDGVSASLPASVWCKLCALLVLGASAAALCHAQTSSRTLLVSEVLVTGNRNISTATILGRLQTRVGQPYLKSTVEEDVKRLSNMGSFRPAHVDIREVGGGVVVEFQVQEYPNLVREIVFKNDRHLRRDDIETLKVLRKGMPLNPTANQRAAYDIQEFYRQKGYLFANVSLEEGGQPGDTRIIFNITEGDIVRVRAISFTGNETLATMARLRTQIDSSRRFCGMPIGGIYNPLMADNDARKLEEYYKNNGYMDVRVTRELKLNHDRFNTVDLVYHIHEGQQYKVKDVTIEGAKNLPDAQLGTIIKAKSGEQYKETTIATDLRNIQDMYGWRGYNVVARRELYFPESDPGFLLVRYEVQDEQRPPSKVGQVIIIGNDVTKDRVIRRALNVYPGQTLQYPELRLGEQMLTRLNIFEVSPETGLRPTVTVLDPDSDSEHKDILVQVKETHTGSLLFGVGINSDAGLVGSVVLNERNFDLFRPPTSLDDILEGRAFRGAGQEFRAEAVPGTQLQRYTVSFREPFLFDQPYSLGVAGYYYDRIYNEYTERRVGARVTLGHQLNRFWSVAGAVRVEEVNVDNVSPFAPTDYTSVAGGNFLVAPRVSVTRDSRDSFLRPTEGSMIEASFEQVFGDFTFPVVNVEGSKYFTIYQRPDGSGKHVLAARSQVSWAGSDAPVFERFYAGGFRSLRGFAFRGVGPEVNGFQIGGDFMFLNSLEYQVPIKANDQLYLVAFIDSGTVERNLEIKDYRVTAGVGARIIVPMLGPVPIALDFGFPIIRGANDHDQIFSFYVGLFR